MARRLGEQTAVGLVIDAEGIARFRRQLEQPWLARLWRRFLAFCDEPQSTASPADLAFAAVITGDPVRQAAAVAATEREARLSAAAWVHPEAGCMTLTGMHRAYALCLAVDWLWPVLIADQRQAILGSIIAHGIENLQPMPDGIRDAGDGLGRLLIARRLDRDDAFCLHPLDAQVNNWDLWFACGLYMAAALAERAWLQPAPGEPTLAWGLTSDPGYSLDTARIDRWRAIARERMDTALANQVGPDGDYGEGVNYAAYGGEALAVCLTMRLRLEGDDLYGPQVLAMPHWLRDQLAADPEFGVFNFNDARSEWRPAGALIAHITAQSRDPLHAGILHETLEHRDVAPHVLTFTALDTDIAAAPVSVRPQSLYARTGQYIRRDGDGRRARILAAQCGTHGGAHQHRDRGGFWLAAHGQRLLVDTGDCRYSKPPYPDFAETIAHNCILIDGRGQIGDNAAPVHGSVRQHQRTADGESITFDASACYDGIGEYLREFQVQPERIRIIDTVRFGDAAGAHSLTWLAQGYNADGRGYWTVTGATAVFHRPGVELHITFHAPPSSIRIDAAPLDGEPGGILRLAATHSGSRIETDLRIVAADEAI